MKYAIKIYKEIFLSRSDRHNLLPQTGDTIVEVLIAVAVIGMSLGLAYSISNRATIIGQSSGERTNALKLAESQIEYIKKDIANIANYKDTTAYCILDGTLVLNATTIGSQCLGVDNLYNLSVIYTPATGSAPESYMSKVSWTIAGNSQESNVELVFRP